MGTRKAFTIAVLAMLPFTSHCDSLEKDELPADIDWSHPIYATDFNSDTILQDWSLEGGQSMQIEDGYLVLKSEGVNTKPAKGNHLVAWLKVEVPANFYLEFKFRPKNKQQGLAIIFFNTRGIGGESIFDATLNERDGTFIQYHSGDLNGYHLSYWSGDRHASNLRKNKGFKLIASGSDPISEDQTDDFHRIGIYKNGGIIRYLVNGKPALETNDEGPTNGPAWMHSGWIGLRQMDHTHWAQYESLAIYPLKQTSDQSSPNRTQSVER